MTRGKQPKAECVPKVLGTLHKHIYGETHADTAMCQAGRPTPLALLIGQPLHVMIHRCSYRHHPPRLPLMLPQAKFPPSQGCPRCLTAFVDLC